MTSLRTATRRVLPALVGTAVVLSSAACSSDEPTDPAFTAAVSKYQSFVADEAKAQELLNLFQLEKAFYEIEYEVTNRPSWAHIPLEGTLRILAERGVLS